MNTSRTTRRAAIVALAAGLAAGACGGAGTTADEPPSSEPVVVTTTTVPAETSTSSTTTAPTSAPSTTEAAATVPALTLADVQPTIDDFCDLGRYAELPPAGGTIESVQQVLGILHAARDDSPDLTTLEVPPEASAGLATLLEADAAASDTLAAADEAASTGDVAAAERLVDRYIAHLWSHVGRAALMGAQCAFADPARAANADLSVPLDLHAEQLNVGFGSVWVSQKYGDNVVRVDPETGEILATIEVGTDPLKLQPADGLMWARTLDSFVAIDPASNTVVATLDKADVGPSANRNWAADGAMWICDGARLHRYDPTTLEPVATIDLEIDCGFVYSTPDLVVAWTADEGPGESGQSAAAIVDPASNEVLATVPLPIDVVWPAVFDDHIYFGGNLNTSGVVVNRGTWTVASTVDLPDTVGGGGIANDDEFVYVPTRGDQPQDVLVLDGESFEVVATIEPLAVNGIAVEDGALWVVHPNTNVLQRFDLGT